MKIIKQRDSKNLSHSFAGLLQVISENKEIKGRVIQLLKLNSFVRRLILNRWMEQLRRKQAPEKLLEALACLFDDSIAEKALTFINDHPLKNSVSDRC